MQYFDMYTHNAYGTGEDNAMRTIINNNELAIWVEKESLCEINDSKILIIQNASRTAEDPIQYQIHVWGHYIYTEDTEPKRSAVMTIDDEDTELKQSIEDYLKDHNWEGNIFYH